MKNLIIPSIFALAAVAACSGGSEEAATDVAASVAENVEAAEAAVADRDQLQAMREQFAVVDMGADTSFLTDEERAVVNKLNEVGNLMSEIYLRQRSESNPGWRAEIAASDSEDRDLLLNLFDLHFGPWDTLNENKPFYGDEGMPEGAAFYPVDITREEFQKWIDEHPEDEEAFTSGYTVIRRDEAGRLYAFGDAIAPDRDAALRASPWPTPAWNATPEGVRALTAGVAEWTTCEQGVIGYCKDGYMSRGGSWQSDAERGFWLNAAAAEAPPSSPACARLPDTGFRCVKDAAPVWSDRQKPN